MLRLRQVIFYILVELMLSRLARRVIVSLTGQPSQPKSYPRDKCIFVLSSLISTQTEDCLFVNERPWEDKQYLQPSSPVPKS